MEDGREQVENTPLAATESPAEKTDENIEPTSRIDPSPSTDEEPPQSSLPLFIIAGVGGLVMVIVLLILFQKRK
jgi:hypothetical protein